MVTFSVKNIQVGHSKDTNNEKKLTDEKICFLVLNVFNTAKKITKIKNKKKFLKITFEKIFFFVLNVFNTAKEKEKQSKGSFV